jgi:hypothetical protein
MIAPAKAIVRPNQFHFRVDANSMILIVIFVQKTGAAGDSLMAGS